jgi:hypothetical protein
VSWRPHNLAVFLAGVLLPGCAVSQYAEKRDLQCERSRIPFPSVVALCKRVENELDWSRGGHAIVFGYLGYWCTSSTIQKVYCDGGRLPMADLAVTFELIELGRIQLDTRLNVCLKILYQIDKNVSRPKDQQDFQYQISCP